MWELVWRAFTASLLDLNFLYYTMGLVSVLGLVGAVAILRRSGTLDPASRVAGHVERMRTALPAVIVLSVTTLAAGMQGGFERVVHDALGLDFTWWVYRIEGHFVERLQDALRSPLLDYLLVLVYTLGSFSLYFVPFFILVALGRGASAMRVAGTMAGVWAVGIAFYFLFPVNEVWLAAQDPRYGMDVVNVLFERVPSAATSDAYMRAVNNNFPSLHVALTCGIAMALWYARERALAIVATVIAAGVTLATMYLGIHWVSDVVAGLALAWGAAHFADRYVLRRGARRQEASRQEGGHGAEGEGA